MKLVGGLCGTLALPTSRMSFNSNENVMLLHWVFHWHSVQVHFEPIRTKCEAGLCEALKILKALEFEKLVLKTLIKDLEFLHTLSNP